MQQGNMAGKLQQEEESWEFDEEEVTLTKSYECAYSEARALIPQFGAVCPDDSQLKFRNATISRKEGDRAIVRLIYKWEKGGEDITFPDMSKERKTYSVECSCTSEPILTHEKAGKFDDDTRLAFKYIIDGGNENDKIKFSGGDKVVKDVAKAGSGELYKLVKSGVSSYLCPSVTVRENVRQSNVSGSGQVGKISSPPISLGGGNWLLVGFSADVHSSGRGYLVSRVWQSSGNAKWSTALYN